MRTLLQRSVRVVVHGRVQGVGFRLFTRDAAEQSSVTGWVRNRRDGSVEAELHGTYANVQVVLDAVAQGPIGARVDGVDVSDSVAVSVTGFELRHSV